LVTEHVGSFETARVIADLTLSQTIINCTTINFVIPHVGGAWPAVWDRLMKMNPTLYTPAMNVFLTRFWWDSAGSTFYHQVAGLLGYGVPPSRLLFGTDFPYSQPATAQLNNLNAVLNTTLITPAQINAIFTTNPQTLYAGKINF
jgi:predicted TIM-barrel fold metal-dependent hydrolase